MEPSAESISRDFLKISARLAPQHIDLARETLARVPATRWQLEWYLPWWLGDAFGLDEKIARQFVVSNVLGLASIRLYDDATDEQENFPSADSARELAALLQRAALEMYQPHFDSMSPFWNRANALLGEWREATQRVNHLHLTDLQTLHDLTQRETQTLTQLGAPLKISALAVCQLTAREKNFAALAELLDHILLANVLYDHAVDCDADLDAGRANLFVAAVSPHSQNGASRSKQRARIIQAWSSGDIPRAFFQTIQYHLQRAKRLNSTLAIRGIATYLDNLEQIVSHTHAAHAQRYQHALARATEKMFGGILSPRVERGEHKKKRREYGNPR